MLAAELPDQEAIRLASVQRYAVLDTPPDPRFDTLTRRAAELFAAPIAHVSVVDRDRIWLKSAVGLPQGLSAPRATSFCAHTILLPHQPMVVEDTAQDPRFADNPAVTGQPHIRFYAGVPLLDPAGLGLGTFCILDTRKRCFSGADVEQLIRLAHSASIALEMQRASASLAASEMSALQMLTATPNAVTLLDLQGRILFLNPAGCAAFELAGPPIPPGRPWEDVWPEAERHVMRAHLAKARAGNVSRFTAFGPAADPQPKWWDIAMAPIMDMSGTPENIVCLSRDVTGDRQERQALSIARSQLEAVLESTTDHVFRVDDRWRITYLNRHAALLVGDGRDLIGKTLLDAFPEGAGTAFEHHLRRAACESVPVTFEEFMPSRQLWLEVHAYPTPPGISIFFRNVSDRRSTQAELVQLARQDSLTGLANRRMFREALGDALASDGPVAVLLIDLDHFKDVNDTLGHPVGDRLLREAADRLRAAVIGPTIVARVGGDEYAIILSGAGHETAADALARRIVADFLPPFLIEGATFSSGASFSCGASIGIGFSEDAGRDPDALMKNADLALYAAKAAGRGTYRFFNAAMAQSAAAREALKSLLRGALGRAELSMVYQPILDLGSGRIMGFEALLRWNRNGAIVAPPDVFIQIAEETGLIAAIGAWALAEACRQAALWPDPIWVAVNLSPVQFRDLGLVDIVSAALQVSGLPADRLELEITENALLRDDEATINMLEALHRLGVRIVLDDFGTGHASLGYLNNFVFDKIKVDRSFILKLPHSAASTAIVRAVTSMGHSLGMTITAEGVETPEQYQAVRLHGCGQAQGYLFGRPTDAADATRLLARLPNPALSGAEHRPRIADGAIAQPPHLEP